MQNAPLAGETAALIVRAVKAHEPLIAALRDLLAYLDTTRPGPDRPPYAAIVAARKALALDEPTP